MHYRIRVQVPVVKRGLFGRKRIVYKKRTILADGKTYRRIQRAQRNADLNAFLNDMEIMDTVLGDR